LESRVANKKEKNTSGDSRNNTTREFKRYIKHGVAPRISGKRGMYVRSYKIRRTQRAKKQMALRKGGRTPTLYSRLRLHKSEKFARLGGQGNCRLKGGGGGVTVNYACKKPSYMQTSIKGKHFS